MGKESSYFDVLAEVGFTKHPGGLKATKQLIGLCHIDKNSYVLDVGCSVGVTAVYLAKKYGCKVVGLDLSNRMLEWAVKRIKKEKVEDKVRILAGDAQYLPFNNNLFDAVISESVTSFPKNKQQTLKEYARVTKKGGYVGLNEPTWLNPNTSEEIRNGLDYLGEIKPQSADTWKRLMKNAGLQDIVSDVETIYKLGSLTEEIKLLGIKELLEVWKRWIVTYTTSSDYRKKINEIAKRTIALPKGTFGTFGYGLYVGRK